MNIILGKENADPLKDKYIVLELDTITIGDSEPITAFCVLDAPPSLDPNITKSYANLHTSLMENYHRRDWNFCEQAVEQLMGFWHKELDSFYENINTRIQQYKENDPGPDWTGFIAK